MRHRAVVAVNTQADSLTDNVCAVRFKHIHICLTNPCVAALFTVLLFKPAPVLFRRTAVCHWVQNAVFLRIESGRIGCNGDDERIAPCTDVFADDIGRGIRTSDDILVFVADDRFDGNGFDLVF